MPPYKILYFPYIASLAYNVLFHYADSPARFSIDRIFQLPGA